MLARNRAISALIGLSVGVLLALLVAPNSRWMVLSQLRLFASPSPPDVLALDALPLPGNPSPTRRADARLLAAARRRPNDASVQIARMARWGHDARADLAEMPESMRKQPAVLANVLRASASTQALRGERAPGWPSWQEMLSLARAGAAADPDNAFFPSMEAVALFRGRRGDEAVRAISRAAGKPVWNDYASDFVRGAWRTSDLAFGAANTFWRVDGPVELTLPHYSLMRDLGRLATARAWEMERAGRLREGYAIRRDVMRLGATMAIQSSVVVGSYAGRAMQSDAAQMAPEPAPPAGSPVSWRPDVKPVDSRFVDLVRRAGYPADVAWLKEQARGWDECRAIVAAGVDRFDILRGLRGYALWFMAAQLALDGALWTLALGALALLGIRLEGRAGARWLLAAAAVALLALVLPLTAQGLAVVQPALARPGAAPSAQAAGGIVLALAALLPAAVTLAVIAVGAYRDGEPLAVDYFRRFSRSALPVACVMLIGYGLLVVRTAQVGDSTNRVLARMVQHEGRFYADLTGKTWPGAVPNR